MNQQLIDQLVKLATIRVNNPLVNSDGKVVLDDWQEGVSMSKLIELTVRECVSICMKNQFDGAENYNNGSVSSAEFIKDHFGVE